MIVVVMSCHVQCFVCVFSIHIARELAVVLLGENMWKP